MPRLTKSQPKYRRHRASGQAIVTLNGQDHYLGPYGTQASHDEYDRLVGEWTTNGRRLPRGTDLTIAELIACYWKFAESHYRKNGEPTKEIDNIRQACRTLKRLYGSKSVREFGPKSLKAIQQQMIDDNLSRGVINSRVGKIKRMFRWAVSEELAPENLSHALATVQGLQKGRTEAREAIPIGPVDDATVDATLPHLPAVVADMVCLQRLIGCRPSEVCTIRPCDIDRRGDVWLYRPASHKCEHHGRGRTIAIGPRAQAILTPYLFRESTSYCFAPLESERQRKDELRAKRKTKVQPSQADRSKQNAKRKPGDHYTRTSYLWAVRRACGRAFPEPDGLKGDDLKAWKKANWWHPNQLRHSLGTEVRQRFGLEAAQVVLGHSKADVTQVYAERDQRLAVEVARQVG